MLFSFAFLADLCSSGMKACMALPVVCAQSRVALHKFKLDVISVACLQVANNPTDMQNGMHLGLLALSFGKSFFLC